MSGVRTLNAILMLLGALSVLMLGAAPAAADAAPPSCHETPTHHGPDTSQTTTDGVMMAMGCCIACVTAPDLEPPVRGRIAAPSPLPAASPLALPTGLSPAPEHGPPR